MLKAGYSKETSAGIVAAGGALGPIVPPSVTMIIYGAALDLSIPDMFMASIIPGLFIALVLIIVNTVQALKLSLIHIYAVLNSRYNRLHTAQFFRCLQKQIFCQQLYQENICHGLP